LNSFLVIVEYFAKLAENKDKDSVFLWRFIHMLRSYSTKTELIFLSLSYNQLTVSLSSMQLLNTER